MNARGGNAAVPGRLAGTLPTTVAGRRTKSRFSGHIRRPSLSAGFGVHNFSSDLCDAPVDRSGEAQEPALLRPRYGEITDPFQLFGRQLDRLATGEDRLDDVGREKAEWEDPADIALIDAMTFGEITD